MYFIELESGECTKVDADFIFGETEVPADVNAVYLVGKSFAMKRTLVPEGGKIKGAPRRYSLPDGTRKLRSEMTESELNWVNDKLRRAREAKKAA